MPELPEVEVLRLSLLPRLPGETIERVEVAFPMLREPVPIAELEKLEGRRIEALRRRAKYLLIDVEGGTTLVIHLGMSGRLTLLDAESFAEPEPHEHVNFHLQSGARLRFRDPRRFGLVFAASTAELDQEKHFAHLGVEPLDESFDGELLEALSRGCRGPVKTFIMDARRVVGVGNIYACEALFRAGVHPNRSVARIASQRWLRIGDAVREVLADAIHQGGTTLNDFANADGDSGYFQVSLSVYGREGESCDRCGATIKRMVHSNRSTFYCPRCQR